MQRLSGLDAAFLSMETASMHNHVAGTFIFDPSTMEGGYSFSKFVELVKARLPLLPPFRRRVKYKPSESPSICPVGSAPSLSESDRHSVSGSFPSKPGPLSLISIHNSIQYFTQGKPL